MNNRVEELFSNKKDENHLTIYALDNDFVNYSGKEYITKYKDTEHFINTEAKILTIIKNLNNYIYENTNGVSECVDEIFHKKNVIQNFLKLCIPLLHIVSTEMHQAPLEIDPIFLVEGEINNRHIGKLISKIREAAIKPKVFVLIKSTNFEDSKQLFNKCPNNTHIHYIKNDLTITDYSVVNTGANNLDEFIESFGEQCFTTCSETDKNIIFNKKWDKNEFVKKYVSILLKIRSNLIYDRKDDTRNDIYDLLTNLSSEIPSNDNERLIVLLLKCIANIYKVYCDDFGGAEIIEAQRIAKELDNDLLNAFVYRYVGFDNNASLNDKNCKLQLAIDTFENYRLNDLAIYCKNNKLFSEFYKERINIKDFNELRNKTECDTPGLVGRSYIHNNVGVANLYNGNIEVAINEFVTGQAFASERPVQYYGLKTNEMIAKTFYGEQIDSNEIFKLSKSLIQALGYKEVPFLTANYMANIVSIAAESDICFANSLINDFDLNRLFRKALNPNLFGCASLYFQLSKLKYKYQNLNIQIKKMKIPNLTANKRTDYLGNNLKNPTIYNTWL